MLESLLGLPSGVTNMAASPPALPPSQPDPKGLFGIKGDMRSILGILGDSLSVGAGGTAKFTAGNQQRKVQAAMQNFTTDPLGSIQALSEVDPELARKLYDDYHRQTLAAGKDQRDVLKDTAELNDKTLTIEDKVRANIAAMLRSSANESTLPALRNQAIAYGKKYNVDVSDLPDKFDKDAIDSWAMRTLPVKEQLANEDRNADNDRAERTLMANTILAGGRLTAGTNLRAGNMVSGTATRAGNLVKPTGKGSKTTGAGRSGGMIRINKTDGTVEYKQPDGTWKPKSK